MSRSTTSRRFQSSSLAVVTVLAVLALLAAGELLAQPQQVDRVQQQFCALNVPPDPTGVTDRPVTSFNSPFPDYFWVHSSTHLQGKPDVEKHAPGLFYNPPGSFSDFESVVVVDNPSPTATATVTVQFYDTQGTALVPATTVALAPERSIDVSAAPLFTDPASLSQGLGSAVVTSDQPIVGATLHHAYGIPGLICDPDPFTPGASSKQQLQKKQTNKTSLAFGPIPISNQQSHDFLNGILPLVWVRNPTNSVNNITIKYTSNTGLMVGPISVQLQPNGSVLDLSIVNAAFAIYTGSNPFNAYYLVEAVSTDGLPLVGEVILTDFFGPEDGLPDNDGDLMDLGARFRMGSGMMATDNNRFLVNPELTYQTGDPAVVTFVGLWNNSNVDVGPVTVTYRGRNGGLLGTDTLTNLPAGQPAVIGPGLASSPNYPAPGVFDGWVKVTACKKGLIGWSMRQTESSGFNKVYGETLHGTNNQEPGNGFAVNVGGTDLIRKVKPVSQVDDSFFWPAYTNFVNESVGNIGPYFYRFHDFYLGTDITDYTLQPFAGVQFNDTSFTYEDDLVNTFFFSNQLVSGRVDHTSGNVKGIGVIGDPLIEWLFQSGWVSAPTCTPANP